MKWWGKAMRTGVIRMKCRKTEAHAAVLWRSHKSVKFTIAFCFKNYAKNHTIGAHFCASHAKTETKFIDANKIYSISHK